MNLEKKSNASLMPRTNFPSFWDSGIKTLLIITTIITLCLEIAAQNLRLDRPLNIKWSYHTSALSSVTPVAENQSICLVLTRGTVISLQASDGQLIWQTSFGGDVLTVPIVDSGSVYVANEVVEVEETNTAETAVFIRALSRANGVVRWFLPFPKTVQYISDTQTSTLFINTVANDVISVDKNTGAILWSFQLPHRIITAPIINKGRLYLAQEGGEITILEQTDRLSARNYQTQKNLNSFASNKDGTIFTGTTDGLVSSYSEGEGSLVLNWQKRLGTEVQSLSLTAKGLLIASRDNSITYLKWQNGRRLWKRHLDDRLAVPPTLTEDAGLFAPLGEDVCLVLSLRDGKHVNTLSLGKNNSVVASPLIVRDILFVPTKIGLLAFTAHE